jgi:hypothetical protein
MCLLVMMLKLFTYRNLCHALVASPNYRKFLFPPGSGQLQVHSIFGLCRCCLGSMISNYSGSKLPSICVVYTSIQLQTSTSTAKPIQRAVAPARPTRARGAASFFSFSFFSFFYNHFSYT